MQSASFCTHFSVYLIIFFTSFKELALTVLNSDWEELERKLNILTQQDEDHGASIQNGSPHQKSKGPAGQVRVHFI